MSYDRRPRDPKTLRDSADRDPSPKPRIAPGKRPRTLALANPSANGPVQRQRGGGPGGGPGGDHIDAPKPRSAEERAQRRLEQDAWNRMIFAPHREQPIQFSPATNAPVQANGDLAHSGQASPSVAADSEPSAAKPSAAYARLQALHDKLTDGKPEESLSAAVKAIEDMDHLAYGPRDDQAFREQLGMALEHLQTIEDLVDDASARADTAKAGTAEPDELALAGDVGVLASTLGRKITSARRQIKANFAVPGAIPKMADDGYASAALANEALDVETDIVRALSIHNVYADATLDEDGHFADIVSDFKANRQNARYLIEAMFDTDAPRMSLIKRLIVAGGLSTADFGVELEAFHNWKLVDDMAAVPVEELQYGVQQMAALAASMQGMNDTSAPPDKVQIDGAKFTTVNIARPVIDLTLVHNHMVEHYSTLRALRTRVEGRAVDGEFDMLLRSTRQSYNTWERAKADIDAAVADIAAQGAKAQAADNGKALAVLRDFESGKSALGGIVKEKFDEMDANVLIELGARGTIDKHLFVAPDAAEQLKQAADAARAVTDLEKTLLSDVKGLANTAIADFSNVPKAGALVAFGKIVSSADKPAAILEKAKKAGALSAKDMADFAKAATELTLSSAKVTQGMLEIVGKAYDAAASHVWKHGDEIIARQLMDKADDFKFAAGKIGGIKFVGDLVSGIAAVFTLIDDNASDDDKVDAAFDLAGAASGIGFGVAETLGVAGAGAAGTAVGFGLAYVQLLRHEFAKIAAIEERARDNLRTDAYSQIVTAANAAVGKTARAAAASELFKNQAAAEEQFGKGVTAKGQERHERLIQQAITAHEIVFDTVDDTLKADHVSEVLVGYDKDAAVLRKAFLAKGREGKSWLKAGKTSGNPEKGLAKGAPLVFAGVREVGEAFAELDKKS